MPKKKKAHGAEEVAGLLAPSLFGSAPLFSRAEREWRLKGYRTAAGSDGYDQERFYSVIEEELRGLNDILENEHRDLGGRPCAACEHLDLGIIAMIRGVDESDPVYALAGAREARAGAESVLRRRLGLVVNRDRRRDWINERSRRAKRSAGFRIRNARERNEKRFEEFTRLREKSPNVGVSKICLDMAKAELGRKFTKAKLSKAMKAELSKRQGTIRKAIERHPSYVG